MPELNRHLLRKIRDAIEMEPDIYDQSVYGHSAGRENIDDVIYLRLNCKTPGCIAGHAVAIEGFGVYGDIDSDAQIHLGLTDRQNGALFNTTWETSWLDDVESPLPDNSEVDVFWPTATNAVKVLNRLIKHGFAFS